MIIGRKKEQQLLLSLVEKEDPQFCVVYGRRRVGKTYLVRETFNYRFAFQHTGVAKGTFKQQLAAWRDSLRLAGMSKCTLPKSWFEAFDMLKNLIQQLPSGKKVIYIDELPWMDTPKSNLLSALELFWNGWATARAEKDIVLIVCGSATSWISKKLLKDKGGLRGRLTEKLMLRPFTLAECEQYAQAQGLTMERRDVLETYMILGGIPYYWSFLRRGQSVAQNTDALFFAEDAPLGDEFEALYHVLFRNPAKYMKVIDALSNRRMGSTREEILRQTKLEDGGSFTSILEDLEQCGFIRRYVPFGGYEQGALYQLIDNYTLFHYRCIRKNSYRDEHYWSHTCNSAEHNVWLGLAFERVCLQHIPQIKEALGVSGVMSNVCSWRTEGNAEHPGAQIDLLISRSDNVINLCEMKYCHDLYSLEQQDAEDLQRKLNVFRQVTGTRHSIHLTLVTTFGLKQSGHWNMVQNEITMDDLFRQ